MLLAAPHRMVQPGRALNGTPASRQEAITSATCSTVGVTRPPQRSFTRAPSAATAPIAAGRLSRQLSSRTSSK